MTFRRCFRRFPIVASCFMLFTLVYLKTDTFAVSAGASQPKTSEAQPTTVEGITAEIVKARDYTSQMVVLASKNFAAGSDQYNRAFTLYAQAYADYGAWAAYLTMSLRAGHAKHLNNNSEYDGVAKTAQASASAFSSYVVTTVPGSSHQVVTLISGLADLGIKLWTTISNQHAQQRNNLALSFCESTKWQPWQEISDPQSSKQTAPDYCKLPSSTSPDSTNNSSQQDTSSNSKPSSKPKNSGQSPK